MRDAKATVVAVVGKAARHGNPCAIAGAFLVLAGLCALFVDQSRAQREAGVWSDIARGARPSPLDAVDPLLEGQPVFIAARAQATQRVLDPVFAISADAVALYRHVETYQWIEFEHVGLDGQREWRYATDWDDTVHASAGFHEPLGHANPLPELASAWFVSTDARVGPFRIDDRRLLEQAIEQSASAQLRAAPTTLGDWPRVLTPLPGGLAAGAGGFVSQGDRLLRASVAQTPSVGDIRVSFKVFPRDYSVAMLGTQREGRVVPWSLPNGDDVFLAGGGAFDATTLVAAERTDAAMPGSPSWRMVAFGSMLLGMAGVLPLALAGLRRVPVFATKPVAVQIALVVAATLAAGMLAMLLGRGWGGSPVITALVASMAVALGVAVATWRRRSDRAERATAPVEALQVAVEIPQQVAAAQELLARRRARLAAIRALTLQRAALRNIGEPNGSALAPSQRPVGAARIAAMSAATVDAAPVPVASRGAAVVPTPAHADVLARTQATRARQMRQLLDQGFATVPPQSTVVRRCVATRGEWTLNRIARIERSAERIIGFELLRDGVVVKRGSETEVRDVLRESASGAPQHRRPVKTDPAPARRPASGASARAG